MKLRNKKTGEIRPAEAREDGIYLCDKTTEQWYKFELSLLAEYWEYYEEPKALGWRIDEYNEPEEIGFGFSLEELEYLKEIGLWFESEEEAKRAVEKLKALKRLKDRGLRFNKWTIPEEPKTSHIKLVIEAETDVPDSPYDLDLLFGGGEE